MTVFQLVYQVGTTYLFIFPKSSFFVFIGAILVLILIFLAYHFYLSTQKITSELAYKTQELKTIHHILQDKNEELESYIESNIRLSQFAYVVSHDLKSSLNTIKSFSNLLKLTISNNLGKKEKEYFDYIEKAAASSEALVMDTLYYAQVKATPLQIKEVNVAESINYLLVTLNHLIEESRANIQIEKLPQKVKADEKQLKKVFEVLLTNAIKFTPPTKIPSIRIWAEEHETKWTFYMKDNGISIKPENREKIFNEFIKLNSKYEYPGTGLGLAIGKHIIEKHSGSIWVMPSSEQGNTIAFSVNK